MYLLTGNRLALRGLEHLDRKKQGWKKERKEPHD